MSNNTGSTKQSDDRFHQIVEAAPNAMVLVDKLSQLYIWPNKG